MLMGGEYGRLHLSLQSTRFSCFSKSVFIRHTLYNVRTTTYLNIYTYVARLSSLDINHHKFLVYLQLTHMDVCRVLRNVYVPFYWSIYFNYSSTSIADGVRAGVGLFSQIYTYM